MKTGVFCLSLALLCLLAVFPAWALTPEEILEKSDQAEFGAQDVVSVARMVLEDKAAGRRS